MFPNRAIRTDLVIGMTLAEIFLLILFVVWYSQGTGSGPDWKRIAEERQQQIDDLKSKLERAQEAVAKLERIHTLDPKPASGL